MISMNSKYWKSNVNVLIFIVQWSTHEKYHYSDLYNVIRGEFSVGKKVYLISPSPRQYLLSKSIVLFNVCREGLFASKRSPPSNRKSTYSQVFYNIVLVVLLQF